VGRPVIDKTGGRYGRLVVIERSGRDKQGRLLWLCKCDCGTEKIIAGASLHKGNTKSCGCLRKEILRGPHRRHELPFGEASFNAFIRSIKHGAKRYGRIWDLTNEQVRNLVSQPCFYCGAMPVQFGAASSSRHNGVFLRNSLDRVDNTKGYTIDNVVPCCDICNGAKCKMPQSEFLDWIHRLCAFRKGLEEKNETLP